MDARALIFYAAVVVALLLMLAPNSAGAGAVRSLGDGIRGCVTGGAG